MPRRSILTEEESTDIDLSPMIDCIFLLLIFFIVTTVFVEERGFQVDKPDAAAATEVDEGEDVVFEITAEDEIRFESEAIALSDVTARVRERVRDPDTPVIIRANAKSSHGAFVAVYDAARRGGAEMLSFTTVD